MICISSNAAHSDAHSKHAMSFYSNSIVEGGPSLKQSVTQLHTLITVIDDQHWSMERDFKSQGLNSIKTSHCQAPLVKHIWFFYSHHAV